MTRDHATARAASDRAQRFCAARYDEALHRNDYDDADMWGNHAQRHANERAMHEGFVIPARPGVGGVRS